jgi:hypothetical protein
MIALSKNAKMIIAAASLAALGLGTGGATYLKSQAYEDNEDKTAVSPSRDEILRTINECFSLLSPSSPENLAPLSSCDSRMLQAGVDCQNLGNSPCESQEFKVYMEARGLNVSSSLS